MCSHVSILVGAIGLAALAFLFGREVGKGYQAREVERLATQNQVLRGALDFIRAEGELLTKQLHKQIETAHIRTLGPVLKRATEYWYPS